MEKDLLKKALLSKGSVAEVANYFKMDPDNDLSKIKKIFTDMTILLRYCDPLLQYRNEGQSA